VKVSKYTFLFAIKEAYYIYNTLSNALLKINKNGYDILIKSQSQNDEINKNKIDNELYEELIFRRFLTENDRDEFLVYKAMVEGIRNSNDTMHLTVAPTMDCCFSCKYCFEKKSHSYFTNYTMDSIIGYVKKYKHIKSIHLTWFGGEPLMAIDKMQKFYNRFRPKWEKTFTSNIITTAFHITPEVIDILKEIEVSSMQITIDGNKDSHNKIKFIDSCDDVFSKILENIDLITEKASDIRIIIRVNITKENSKDYVGLYKSLCDRYRGKNVSITPAIVLNRGEHDDLNETSLFTKEEYVNFSVNLWNESKIGTAWTNYPDRFISECAIRNKNSLTIDSDGYVYKCWEVIGNKKHAVGRLEKGNIYDVNQIELNRNMFGADPLEDKNCSKCEYLPLCGGGCPIQRIENEFENGKNNVCTTYKNHISDLLSIYLEIKTLMQQYKN
jgi:uncharacterized protein